MPRAGRWADPMQPPWPRHGACAALPPRPGRPLGDGGWVELLARLLARCHRANHARARASARQRELVTCLPVGT
eukprot:5581822-Pleurochrysis_carterae.AAC.1